MSNLLQNIRNDNRIICALPEYVAAKCCVYRIHFSERISLSPKNNQYRTHEMQTSRHFKTDS